MAPSSRPLHEGSARIIGWLDRLEPLSPLLFALHGGLLLLLDHGKPAQWAIAGAFALVSLVSFRLRSPAAMVLRCLVLLLGSWLMMVSHSGTQSYFFFWLILLTVTYSMFLPPRFGLWLPLLVAICYELLIPFSKTLPPNIVLVNRFLHINIIGYSVFLLNVLRLRQLQELQHVKGELEQREQQLRHGAFHDPLTGLANRRLLLGRLEQELAQARRAPGYRFAVLFVDLDGFKQVNDALGHAVGDEILVEAVKRFLTCIREMDLLARIGGDEFAVIVSNVRQDSDALHVAERMLAVLQDRPWYSSPSVSELSASIGIAYSQEPVAAEGLLGQADQAMYQAKARGKARYRVFDD
jgi:diguanylate cyclase (GGDEF)-like protein